MTYIHDETLDRGNLDLEKMLIDSTGGQVDGKDTRWSPVVNSEPDTKHVKSKLNPHPGIDEYLETFTAGHDNPINICTSQKARPGTDNCTCYLLNITTAFPW